MGKRMYLWALSYTPCLLVWVKATHELGPASGQFWGALAWPWKLRPLGIPELMFT